MSVNHTTNFITPISPTTQTVTLEISTSNTLGNSFSPEVTNSSKEMNVVIAKEPEKSIIKNDLAKMKELVSVYAKTINEVYHEFGQTKTFKLESHKKCIRELECIESCYKQVLSHDEDVAKILKKNFDAAQQQIQEMNMQSPVVTVQDLRGINSFFQPPLENFYTDSLTGKKYVQPDHSELLKFGNQFFIYGEYTGIGLLRHTLFDGVLCDILYLEKKQDQIDYEYPGFSIPLNISKKFLENTLVKKRIIKQEELQNEAIQYIEKTLPRWKYASFQMCGYNELEDKGLSKEYARKNHAILFHYTKI